MPRQLTNRYPGGPLLNPLGLARDIKNAHDWKLKEIKNGLICSPFFFVLLVGFQIDLPCDSLLLLS